MMHAMCHYQLKKALRTENMHFKRVGHTQIKINGTGLKRITIDYHFQTWVDFWFVFLLNCKKQASWCTVIKEKFYISSSLVASEVAGSHPLPC